MENQSKTKTPLENGSQSSKGSKHPKSKKLILGCLVSGTLVVASSIVIPGVFYIRHIYKVQELNEVREEAQNRVIIEKSLQYQSQNLCQQVARSDQIKVTNYDVLKVPLSNYLSTLVLVSNDKYTRAYLLESSEGQWVGSQLLAKYKISEENGKRILSFEDSILDAQINDYILVVIVPKDVAKNLEIFPFNNQDLGQINSLTTYQTKFSNGYIISQFDALKTVKNKTQPINVELETLFDENLYMGQLLIPPDFDLKNKVLSPIIEPISQCQLSKLMEE